MENFYSVVAVKEFLTIPKILTDIYDEHDKNGTVSGNGKVNLYILNGEKYELFATLYKKDQKYCIEYKCKYYYKTKYYGIVSGNVVTSGIFINVKKLDDKEFQILMNGEEFSVILYTNTNECVCVKYSKEICPRIAVDESDLNITVKEINGEKYWVNLENTIVKPVIQKKLRLCIF